MKRIIYLTAVLVVLGLRSFAQLNSSKEDPAIHNKIQQFMYAQLNNEVAQLRKLLDKDVVILSPGKLGETQISKGEYISFLQQVGKLNQDCYPQYEIIKLTTNTADVNVDFAYPDFIAKHFITMVKKGDEWKIIQLRKSIETKPSPVTVMQQ